jgi:hypothetical protein
MVSGQPAAVNRRAQMRLRDGTGDGAEKPDRKDKT